MGAFKEFLEELAEKVSADCSTGPGFIPDGPYKGWKVKRTAHLDDHRGSSRVERDDGFVCNTFDKLVSALLQKRPMGLKDGELQITWKNIHGYQACILDVKNKYQLITFITVMQLNKRNATQYETKGLPSIDLGIIKEPK